MKAFLKRKNIEISLRRYGIDALGAMAQGLFCSLLIGTILNTLGSQFHIGFLTATIIEINKVGYTIGGLASFMSGAAMAVAIGHALKAPPLVLYSLATVGLACNSLGAAGGPLAVLFVAIIAAECGKVVSKETKVDILVTPIVTTLVGIGAAWVIAPPIGKVASAFGDVIMRATELQPFLMGIAVSVLVGIALTLPISSAAICSVLGLVGLAGGAAVAGCCAHMVGFAVMSFKENRWGGLVSQGLGTSMLQMPNLVRHPLCWLPPILTSAITGPIATCVFKLQMNGAPINSGMGTCGLCGPIGVWTGWVAPAEKALSQGAVAITPAAMDWIGLALVCIVLPAVLCGIFGWIMRRIGWIHDGDLALAQ
ncbi:MAG: PTS sugar transporter subunit IIC [Oscillospiraceae bacterium]|nr:PTS sugar transporter subunit IIC [Oscillospiraceae bacterium]